MMTLIINGCKEPFPAYEEPKNVLSAHFRLISFDTLYAYQDSTGQYIGKEPVVFEVIVKNEYYQLLQGQILVKGKLNCIIIAPVIKVSSLTLGREDMRKPPIFQEAIAITPGDSAVLKTYWFYTVGGAPVFEGVPYTLKVLPDSTLEFRYQPMTLRIEGSIQIFERVQAIQIQPLEFQQMFVRIVLNKSSTISRRKICLPKDF
jgi:hypothetical protein